MKIAAGDGIHAVWAFESTGRVASVGCGAVVGLDVTGSLTVHTGYDGDLVEDFADLSDDERHELAAFMIEKWRRFGAGEGDGKETTGGETAEAETADDYAKRFFEGGARRRRPT